MPAVRQRIAQQQAQVRTGELDEQPLVAFVVEGLIEVALDPTREREQACGAGWRITFDTQARSEQRCRVGERAAS
jgi:hypothetical protein